MKFLQIASRAVLFLLVNILVMATLGILMAVIGVPQRIGGDNFLGLLVICTIFGMAGAFISLLTSRWMAKTFNGVQVIDPNTRDEEAQSLVQTVYRLARAAGLSSMPEVGIYESPEINAFATGPSQSMALVAVSSGLLRSMPPKDIEAVLGHEITHISNGDMVTMTLIQGVVNSIAMFLGWVVAIALTQNSSRDNRRSGGDWFIQYMLRQLFQSVFMVLGFLVVAKFSRWREFRADAGGARLAGRENMIAGLKFLQQVHEQGADQMRQTSASVQALQISGKSGGFLSLFATHPPIEERISRLEHAYIS